MSESAFPSPLVVPGTYIRVRAEGLISVGGVSTGNIGIVGTANEPPEDPDDPDDPNVEKPDFRGTHLVSDYASARKTFGSYGALAEDGGQLTRSLELAYRNGARIVYARAVEPGSGPDVYTAAFEELVKDDVNILIAPELSTEQALAVLPAIVATAAKAGHDMIAVIGSDAGAADAIASQVGTNDRIVMTAPGIVAYDASLKKEVTLAGTYTAAAFAGLLSTLAPQSSPTNKVLPGVTKLAQRFPYGDVVKLLDARVAVLEQRRGVRVVRGLTTDEKGGPFSQITTRRITDLAKAGIRQAADPFIGRLNNQRVRKALHGAIDGFLTTMLVDEALTHYTLDVTATRQDEVSGRAVVTALLRPTFSIDYVVVTLVLE